MAQRAANKMFLVSPHQLNRMTQSIRQTAGEDLDEKMRAILNDKGLSSYEKIKRYDALPRRYLAQRINWKQLFPPKFPFPPRLCLRLLSRELKRVN